VVWCFGGRDKRLNTGKPVFDEQHVLLHQQREMQLLRADVQHVLLHQQRETQLLRAQVENVTGLLLHQTELMQRLAGSVSAKVRLQSHVWQSGNRNF